jgi:uncharacterized protein YjbI with pentapeptide repeats
MTIVLSPVLNHVNRLDLARETHLCTSVEAKSMQKASALARICQAVYHRWQCVICQDLTPAHPQRGALLSKADLVEAQLIKANLRGASLWGANLREADLWGADLTDADLTDAVLTRAVLRCAICVDAQLSSSTRGNRFLQC